MKKSKRRCRFLKQCYRATHNAAVRTLQMMSGGGGIPTMQRFVAPDQDVLDDQPLYVNAKQYHRILKRRQARAKLEAQGKIPKQRQVRLTLI